jgi:type IV pilus assembly protein PilP
MKMKVLSLVSITFLSLLLAACGGGGVEDLDAFMAEKKSGPGGHIQPIPPFKAYKSFTYSAAGLRSPFERPVEVREITRLQRTATVKPDENRAKEYLEQFSLDSLAMVGTLNQSDTLWILMQDRDGGVHRVKEGNYMGRNHGKIISTTETYLSLIEIVSTGSDGWVERPRTINLKSVED